MRISLIFRISVITPAGVTNKRRNSVVDWHNDRTRWHHAASKSIFKSLIDNAIAAFFQISNFICTFAAQNLRFWKTEEKHPIFCKDIS